MAARAPARPPEITEKAFTQQVTDLARMLGWATYHPWLSLHSPRGWPDLAICKPPRLILAELKTRKGKLSDHQDRWLALLRECPGVEVYVWRPDDLDDIGALLMGQGLAPFGEVYTLARQWANCEPGSLPDGIARNRMRRLFGLDDD